MAMETKVLTETVPSSRLAHAAPSNRVLSVDVLRGITIAFMILVNDPGDWSHVFHQLDHAQWNGWTVTDLVFPTFLFIVGASIVFSMSARSARGNCKATLTGRIFARVPDDPSRYLGGLNLLGQPLWSPAGPNGFPDSNAAWAAPEGMKLRLDIASQLASRAGNTLEVRDLLQLAIGDAASSETRLTIERAESRQQALALLLMSPEFQRR